MADGKCDQCGCDLPEDTLHTFTECFANMHSKIEELEDIVAAYAVRFGPLE